MKYSNTVEYNIKTSLDSKGLTQLKSELQGLELKLQNMGNKGFLDEKTFVEARNQIQGLGQALTDAFNPSLGMLDLSKLNQELKNNDVTAQGLKTAFSSLGAEGQVAFNNLVGELGKLDTGILRTNSQVDKLFTTFSNTFRWGLVSSFFSQFMNAIHSSVDYVKELDDSLTQIMLVTDYNRDSMNQFAKSANEAAKAVSMTTTGMTNASLIFAQQGYDLNQSQQLATLSAKLANASQQDTATTSDQITAYMNAYGLQNSMEELTQQMDNWALIANVSAADVGELAQAAQKAASMANAVGVSGEALAAQIATIESVTREAPEQIGNGLKTLYARFSDIKLGKTDDGVDLGKVTETLDKIGVNVLDKFGNIREMDNILEDLMDVWADLDDTTKLAAGQALAGKYQINRFYALMDNRDMYEQYVGATGSAATGTLDQMNEEFADSIEGRSAKLQASLEGLFSTVFNTDDIYPWMDAAQGAVDLLQQFFDALGGGKTVLLGISSLLMQVFSKNMAQEINNAATNRAVQQQKIANLQHSEAALSTMGLINPNPEDQNSKNILDFAQYMNKRALEGGFNAEQMNQANAIYEEMIQNANAATMANEKLEEQLGLVGTVINSSLGRSGFAPFADFSKAINSIDLKTVLGDLSDKTLADFFKNAQQEVEPAKKGLLDFNKSLQEYGKLAANSGIDTEILQQKMNELQQELKELSNYLDDSTFNRYDEALDEIANDTEAAEGKTNNLAKSAAHLAEELDKVTAEGAKKAFDNLQKTAFQSANADIAAEDSNATRLAFQESNEKTDHITNILNTLNAVQQLTFAWQAFQNLGSLWANEDLSTGEKVLQIIMNLTMAMPQLISALQSIKNTQIFGSIGNLFSAIPEIGNTANIQGIQQLLEMQDKGVAAYDKMMEAVGEGAEIADGLEDVWRAGEKATETLSSMDQGLVELVKNGGAAGTELTGVAKIFADGMAAAMTEGATGAGLFAGGLKAVGAAAAEAIVPLLPFIAIGAAIAGIAFIIGQEAEKAKKAKEEALEAFDEAQSKLEEMQALQEKVNNFQTNFESKKSEGKGFEGLADEARDLADALKEAGHASESADIRLAATKATALGTEEAYQELADTVKTASLQAEMDTNTDAQRAAMAVLDTQKADLDEIAQKQATLRDLKEQLNNLDQEDSKRGVLENRIKELEEFISKNQEAVEAANQLREAQAANVGLQLSQQTSDMVHSSGIDDATKRAGTYSEYAGTYDYDTLNEIYSKNVADWDKYSELEKIDIMLHTLQDDAQIAAVEIEQILQTNSSIKDMGYADQGLTADEQRDNITGALENTGLSAEQNLQLMATFDKDATYKEIMDGIAEVRQGLENGEDFDVLLKAKFDPEQIAQGVKDAINAYEPTDEDVDVDAFKNMANYIQSADASAFEEGGMLEDVSPDIQANAEALEDLVEGILRYDDAVSTLNDNEEKWRDALSDSADLQDRAEAVADLKETYSDFLDLGADVSDTFAENADNLDLMAEAAQGDVDAYNELLAAASEDIAVNVYGVDESSAALQQMSDYLQSDAFKDVEVGMAINDDAFYTALNQMSADAGWTAADMENYLSDIGCSIDPSGFEETANSLIDAADQTGKAEAKNLEVTTTTTIDSQTGQETDTTEYTSAIANVSEVTGTSVLPVTAGNLGKLSGGQQPTPVEIPYSIPSVEYTAVPITQTDVQEKTGYAVNTEAKQGGGGKGGVQVKKGSVKKNDSGGTKNRNASSPNTSGNKTGGSCFVAGTLITTLTGFKPIEEIQKGDIVLSYNERIKVNEYSEVLQTMIHDTTESIYTLHIKNEQLRVTGVHRFLVTNKITCGIPQWVHAADLKAGNWVMFADGSWHVIHKIDINIEHHTVYNFEVSHNHNYYVGRNQILAHNKGGKSCFVAGTQVSTSFGFKAIETIQPNDIVLSYNEQTGYNEYSSVVQTMIHDTKEPIYTLYIQNEQLRVTGIHRFFITNNILTGIPQWIAAENLKVGDWVLFANGTWHVIWKIEVNIEQQTVYNFEVSGNHNYYVGRNQILAHNKGGGKKSGGGGGKKKEISTKEKKNHEKDYYEKVDSILDKTEKTLKGIQDKQDKLIGDKAQGNLRKQINLLEKELKVQKEKLKILTEQEKKDVERKLKKDNASLEKILKKNGINQKIPDFKRDMDGIIINYEEVSAAIDKAYNKLIDKQKAAAKAGKEETAKSIGEQIDKFEKLGESIRKGGKRSDEIQAQIEELNNAIQETEYAIQDARIEGFKLYSEARDGLKDILESGAELKKLFRDFDADSFIDKFSIDDTPYGDLIENMSKLDDIYNITEKDAKSYYDTLIAQKNEALKTETDPDNRATLESSIKFFENRKATVTEDELQNGYLGIVQQDLAKIQEWMENPQAAENIWGTDENGLFETFKDLYNQLLDGFKDYRKAIQEARDNILEIYDDAEEAIERQLKQFDRLTEKIERISDTYTLYYGEDSYDQLDKFYAQQGSIMQAQLNQLTAAYDLWRKNYEKALENGNEELIKKAKDLMDEAEDAMLDGAKELAELWVEKFENAVEANTQSIYNKLFNGQDFNDLSSNWELQKDYMERYKDNVEKSYEIEKLRSKYTDLLNDSQNASLLTQNKIRQQMQEQLQQLQEQATVSEYDVKLANARLEILQKQIALEDAQRNKRQMQLRRDSQGNYRYVYKADQKDVKEAQDDLLDSEFDAYELTKNETISNNDRALNLVQDFLSKRADIFNKYKDDDVARKKALEELSNNYSELLAGMEEDFRDTTNGMFDVLTFMIQNGTEATAVSAANMLDNLFEKEGKFKEDTKVLWAALVNTMTGALEEFQDAIAEANDELIDQTEDLKDKMTGNDGVLTKIGSSSEKMANSLDTATQATMDLAQATDQLFTAFKADDKRMEDALAKLKKYEDQLRSTQDTTSSLSKQLASANAAITAKTAEAQSYQDALDLKNGAKDFQQGQVITLKKGTWVSYHRDGDQYDSKGDNGFRLSKDTQVKISHVNEHHTKGYGDTSQLAKYNIGFYEVGKEATKETGTGLANKSDTKKTERWHLNEAMLRQAITYDTGGYTGQWGGEETNLSKNGKLAVLHQKELVLNATDTENILNAVNVMREITNALKNSNMYVSTFRNAVSAGNDTIEQRVEISATFPNVSSITDIEQALLSLSDQAYQYAHRNIKG